MFRTLFSFILGLMATAAVFAQQVNVLPTLSAESGTYDDDLTVSCTFPEGCAGGKYWINGGEIQAKTYSAPIFIDYDCQLSVAGTDATGRIITDVVSRDYKINRVAAPAIVATPAEGIRKTSFYVTRIDWKHVGTVSLDLAAFKEGGARRGENVVWLVGPDGNTISAGDANNLWESGLNSFKAYIYKNYQQEKVGDYTLHIASGVFIIDGKRLDTETVLNYTIADGDAAPVITPDGGEYKGSVTVSIEYPTDGTAFYKFYKLNGEKAKQYTSPITLTQSTTLEAYGYDEDFTAQTPSSFATFTITGADPTPETLASPTITIVPSAEGKTIVITPHSEGEGSTIKYWTDHRMATAKIYSAPFTVDHNCTISAVAYNDRAASAAVSAAVTDIPADRGDLGEMTLLTPITNETAHLCALSPNGRYAVGYMGSDTSSKGFVWDLEADRVQYASTIYINQLWNVANDGTAYGWRARTMDIDESMTEKDLLFGAFADGNWTEMTADEFKTRYGVGVIDAAAADLPGEVTAVSANGEWAIIGQTHRLHVPTHTLEYLVSMSERFSTSTRPEMLTAITDDGTIFGTYDGASERGGALVRTTDGRWRSLVDWLRDLPAASIASLGLADLDLSVLDTYNFSSVRGATGNSAEGLTLLLHATTKGISSDDAFTRGLVLRINVPIHHLAPAALTAEQMSGRMLVKVSWDAPLRDASAVQSYTLLRNGDTIATLPADANTYYDEAVEPGVSYTYAVKALYADGTMSGASRESTVTCNTESHLAVRNLAARRVGLNGLTLSWDAPIVTLPKLQYFDEDSDSYAFGTGTFNAEFGIRIPASDLSTLDGHKIRTFQFLPSGPQKNYTLNLYRGAKNGDAKYDDEPFYSQTIDPATLNYGTVNTIELTTPQALPADADLYVTLYIESNGNDNMLGISYEGFRSGYTDLCRVEGIHDKMVAISKNSSQVTEIVLPLGVGVASDDNYNGSIVSNYLVADNDKEVANTTATRHSFDLLPEGTHTFAVTAVYRDGKASEPAEVTLHINDNPAAYVAITPEATMQGDGTALISWQTPRDDDRTLIHWGDLTPTPGWPMPKEIAGYMAISVFPVDMTADYAGDYAITEVYFCPMDKNIEYEVALQDIEGNTFGYFAPTDLRIGEINYLRLPNPVEVDPSATYQLLVNIPEAEGGSVALAYDSSGQWKDGYSNIVNYGLGLTTLSEFVQYTEHPNWLMGLVVKKKDARLLPVEGYYVTVDGAQQNASALTATQYTTSPLADGRHTASVDVVYAGGRRVTGSPINFIVDSEGIIHITTDGHGNAPHYDLQGRKVNATTQNSQSPAIVIGENKKQILK